MAPCVVACFWPWMGSTSATRSHRSRTAQEVEREANASVAECFLDRVGPVLVTATLGEEGPGRNGFTCKLNVVDVAAHRIRVERARAITDEVGLDESATNEQTMALYFKSDSLAAVTLVGRRAGLGRLGRGAKGRALVPQYVTSVKRPIELGVDVTPSAFGSIMEWRIDGQAVSLGESATHKFFLPGQHVISVGPRSDRVVNGRRARQGATVL